MNAHAIESEIKRKMPEAESVRVKIHGPAAVYCSASIDGRAHTIFVEPDIAQFYGGWKRKDDCCVRGGETCGGFGVRRDDVDFFEVRHPHAEIHARLLNWARWARGGRGGGSVLPMFKDYRADGYHELQGGGIPIDSLDATAIQKVFAVLPEKHRWALQWTYCYPFIHVSKVCRVLAVTRPALGELVHDGRAMAKNLAIDNASKRVRHSLANPSYSTC